MLTTDPNVADLLTKLNAAGGVADDKPEPMKDPPPGDVGATVETKNDTGLVTLPMTEEMMNLFWTQIEKAENRRKNREASWDLLLNEYMPVVSKSGEAETVKVQAHFRNTQTKLGALFYRSPDLILTQADPGPGGDAIPDPRSGDPQFQGQTFPPISRASIIPLKQAVLKKTLGRDGIKANRLMDELLFDVLQWTGIGCAKIGYRCVMKTIQVPKMVPDTSALPQQPGSVLGLAGQQTRPMIPALDPVTQQPVMEPQQVPIHEEWYARRFSGKKLLVDPGLKSTRYDEDATWLAMDFFLTPAVASKQFGIPEDQLQKAAEDDRCHQWDEDASSKLTGLVHCIELWPKSSIFTPEVNPHPLAMNQLVLIKGLRAKPAVWRPSPDQSFGEDGRITPDSLVGFPIKVLTIRDLADSCFPPSDSAFTNSDIKQMSTWRRQSIRIRDAAIGKYLYDASAFGETEVEQLKNGDVGEFIPVEDGKLKDGADKIFTQTAKVTSTPDDARGFAGIKQDMQETLGIGSNQAGTETETVRTATEADKVASAAQARNEKELSRVVDFYLDMARGIDQLLMRYMTDIEYVEIGGDDAAAVMKPWTGKMVAGKFLYDIAPDSQLRPDDARDYAQMAQYYNLTAKDALSNRLYILKRMATMRGLDPSKAVLPPQPPPPPKPDIKVSLTLTAADLVNPTPMVLELLSKSGAIGVTVNPHQLPPHGGPAERGDVISEHMQSNSGGKQNAPGAENHRESQVK